MKITKQDKEMLRAEYEPICNGREKMLDYYVNGVSCYAELRGYIVPFRKPHINTSFCFGEHGYDYDEVNELCHTLSGDELYFKAENLNNTEAKSIIDAIHGTGRYWRKQYPILVPSRRAENGESRIAGITWTNDASEALNNPMVLTDEEEEYIEQLMNEELEKFEKRLDTYLKRYGMSKCHFWTYWADR